MLKLLHAADLHLDRPFSSLDPAQAALRRAEQRELPDRLCELANDEAVDLVLLSGDLFDGERVYRETAQALSAALGRIRARVFIAPGNHDPYRPTSPYALTDWPENVHVFTSPVPEGVTLPELGCTVYGAAFTQEHPDRSPLSGFRAPQDGLIHLMTLHGDALGGDYGPIAPADVAESNLTYLALGHIHQCSGLQRTGDVFWAYPGCPEGHGFDETGEKGALLVTVDGGSVTADFRPLCRRRYEIVTADLTGAADALAAVEALLPPHTQDDVYRILLTGQYSMAPGTLDRLSQSLASRFYALEVRDRTRMPQDLWARAEEDSLTGRFLRAMRERCDREPENETLQLAARFGLAALERGEDVSP